MRPDRRRLASLRGLLNPVRLPRQSRPGARRRLQL